MAPAVNFVSPSTLVEEEEEEEREEEEGGGREWLQGENQTKEQRANSLFLLHCYFKTHRYC